ncbi:MAG: hypothetical protein EP344_12865 [Bacteroidetes bacterium]|nr:MAG: hypothetical protein EP344_12865 [Bacteroidota bacterium]
MLRFILPALLALLVLSCTQSNSRKDNPSQSEAGESLRLWALARTFPDGRFHTEKYTRALAQMRLEASLRASDRNGGWEAIGPKNIGGRTLCLAVHPVDTNTLYAGSAAGGLWRSTTGGRGVNAWQRIETGFPVLGVSAVAIDPENPEVLYIGTGEVYNLENSMPNVAFRVTRGTYGIGILKSTDGGQTWAKSLDWSYGDLRGVQDIRINPLRPATVYAATTEGLLRSYDAGQHWHTIHNLKMAVDIEISPADTAVLYVTHGSLDDEDSSGVFRSKDGGQTFQLLDNGIVTAYSGKALLTICAGSPNVLYASVGNSFVQEGLYRSTDGGDSWTKVSSLDVCKYQGWYSHDVAVNPANPDDLTWVGIDVWKSSDGGLSNQRKTFWNSWYFGQVPVGGPEGPPTYVHADIHRVYWPEQEPNKVYCVTDGGIFVSYDGGNTWEGRNGGYQTQQFYANLGNSATNPALCIGGMQDNSTAIYTGDPAWTRVLGGDGECAGINPLDDQIMYGSSQYLNLYKSVNGGQNFYNITWGGPLSSEEASFNGPFEIVPSNPDILYAGAQSLFRSNDGGETWDYASNGYVSDGDLILTIAVHPQDPDIVLCSTAPVVNSNVRLFRINASTGAVTELTGLPNRMCMDISYDPVNPNVVYAVFAGFNTEHVWKSTDGGTSWAAIDNGLPDVPANTVLVDPQFPGIVYVGTDLGVWVSRNGGTSWELFSADAPNALLAMHLSISADRQLRVATYGLGVWQTPMADLVSTKSPEPGFFVSLFPNPAATVTTLEVNCPVQMRLRLRVLDLQGRQVYEKGAELFSAGKQAVRLDLGGWPAGRYVVAVESVDSKKVLATKVLVRK